MPSDLRPNSTDASAAGGGLLRLRRPWGCVRRRPKTAAALPVLFVFLLLNTLAFVHAYSMTHFVSGVSKTPRPEQLSRMGRSACC